MPTLLGCKKNHIHDNASPQPNIFLIISRVYSLEDLILTTTKYICQKKASTAKDETRTLAFFFKAMPNL
jgi:hypothetical protein